MTVTPVDVGAVTVARFRKELIYIRTHPNWVVESPCCKACGIVVGILDLSKHGILHVCHTMQGESPNEYVYVWIMGDRGSLKEHRMEVGRYVKEIEDSNSKATSTQKT